MQAYEALVAESWPIGVALEGADVDVICHATTLCLFAATCRGLFQHRLGYLEERSSLDPPAFVCRFRLEDLTFAVFGQNRSDSGQNAYRHMLVEERLLAIGEETLRDRVMALKRQEKSTEEAFAMALGLSGAPYLTLLEFERLNDRALRDDVANS